MATGNHRASRIPASESATVLCVSPFEGDHVFLEQAFRNSTLKVQAVRSSREALDVMSSSMVAVVLCEESLPEGDRKGMLADVVSMPDGPVLIVTSRLADDILWAEVLSMGAYDLLMKPFDATEVFRVVSLAWRHWKENWEKARAGYQALGTAAARANPV